MSTDAPQPRKLRTLFISDVHLGSKAAQAELLLDFLRYHEAETIYLVGDIVDGWRLRRNWHWPQEHNDVVQKLLRKSRKGANIIYIAGNHDEFLRNFQGTHFGGIEVMNRAIHEAADGRKFLVIHGDQFDVVVRNARFIAYLGDWAYDTAIWINTVMSRVRSFSACATGHFQPGRNSASRKRSISLVSSRMWFLKKRSVSELTV